MESYKPNLSHFPLTFLMYATFVFPQLLSDSLDGLWNSYLFFFSNGNQEFAIALWSMKVAVIAWERQVDRLVVGFPATASTSISGINVVLEIVSRQ